jgi:hypothetical protein
MGLSTNNTLWLLVRNTLFSAIILAYKWAKTTRPQIKIWNCIVNTFK